MRPLAACGRWQPATLCVCACLLRARARACMRLCEREGGERERERERERKTLFGPRSPGHLPGPARSRRLLPLIPPAGTRARGRAGRLDASGVACQCGASLANLTPFAACHESPARSMRTAGPGRRLGAAMAQACHGPRPGRGYRLALDSEFYGHGTRPRPCSIRAPRV